MMVAVRANPRSRRGPRLLASLQGTERGRRSSREQPLDTECERQAVVS